MDVIESPVLAHPRIAHGFFTRNGGVSTGIFASLNCGSLGVNDTEERVDENRRRVAKSLGFASERLVSVRQVHGANVAVVDEPWRLDERPAADAMVTARRGVALGVLSADCAPVLFAAADAQVVGAAHAGWKGALGGVIGATVEAMLALGARREKIVAVVGPTIARESYEVDEAFAERFDREVSGAEVFFSPGVPGRRQFDLPAFVRRRLHEAGVAEIALLAIDTYANDERLFSFRRSTHRGEPDYGRQISVIGLTAA